MIRLKNFISSSYNFKFRIMASKKNVNIHIIVLYLFLILISIGITARIIDVQKFTTKINTNSQPKYFKVKELGVNIMADDGSLAVSMPLYDIRLDRVRDDKLFNEKVNELSNSLSKLFGDKAVNIMNHFLEEQRIKKETSMFVKIGYT